MKNLLSPETLATFKRKPAPIKEIVKFLDSHQEVSVSALCKIIEVAPRVIYDYQYAERRLVKKEKKGPKVTPKSNSKKYSRYTAEEKYDLIEEYLKANEEEKSSLLRTYGIYQSDIQRWRDQTKEAALLALGRRKVRSDKKTDDQLKIEQLEKDLKEQERTTAKLSTLLLVQKKLSIS
ncbi:MAG: hypothetical protein HQK52_23235 [Oligoflexia bacterium]|nr:hypothetical protein [Oligoflexia bacterium]